MLPGATVKDILELLSLSQKARGPLGPLGAEEKRQAVVPWTGIDLWLSDVGWSM
jgi:hypothetical protein